MTQPTPQQHWLSDLLKRYRGVEQPKEPRQGYQPIGFDFNRPPFDTSSFFRELDTLKNISTAGTSVLKQRVSNQNLLNQQKQAIDLSGVTPRFTGTQSGQFQPGQKTGRLGAPLSNYSISSGYGPRRAPTAGASSWHRGLDMAAPAGTPIYATHDGVVNFSGWGNGYGNHVSINGSGGIQTFYGHNSRNVVRTGQRVRQGQVIGYVGSTGVSTGPHLHYEVRINGQHVDPRAYL